MPKLYVSTRKGLFTLERGPRGWEIRSTAFLAANVPAFLPDPRDGALYAALNHGHFGAKLHRSEDGGRTWSEIAAPKYPEKPADAAEVLCPMRHVPIPWNIELIWTLEAGGPDRPGELWLGTIPGGLFHSPDRGASWGLNMPLWNLPARKEWFGGGYDYPGIHSICVDPRDSRRVTVGVSCGGAWLTPDAGQSWECRAQGMRAEFMPPEQQYNPHIQDPHRLVACPAAPDCQWTQHHNGIFRTIDAGRNWTELRDVPVSSFGFAVAVHPRDPNCAWFVPAQKDEHRIPVDGKLVVLRTRDGGRSFQELRRGLPQEHAYHLVYRHALDIDAAGDTLAFGSTTGTLYVSEDQGDSWTCAAQHLPPVYSVRFAP